MQGAPLFAGDYLPTLIQRQGEQLSREAMELVSANPGPQDREIVDHLVRKFKVEPPVLEESRIAKSLERGFADLRGTSYAFLRDIQSSSTEIDFAVYTVPFSGEGEFFGLRPSTYSLSSPRAEVGRGMLVFQYPVLTDDPARIKAEFERDLHLVRDSLRVQHGDVAPFMATLPERAAQAVADAKRQASARTQFLDGL